MDELTIIRSLGILSRTFVSTMSKELTATHLSFSESIFLINIGENEGITQEALASFLAIDKAAVARSVKALETKAYLLTKKSASDKRAKNLFLTEKGHTLYQEIYELHIKWAKKALSDLSQAEIHHFASTIEKISEQAKQSDEERSK
ncbi:MarR family transcriptional regulator [Eubacteriaceae bacterium ES3]|nr:MarR family transcriptional regulator [Eubacteriaceae bacterium ES3]